MKDKRLPFNRELFCAGERVCVAISGGADSVALLLALADANRERDSIGVVLSAIHVNHGLRGTDAEEDEAFVRDLCGRLEIPITVEQVDVAARQVEEGEGLEEAARELRYQVFWSLMNLRKADTVVTAHTMNDQAETVVMKLLRGAWTKGISAISPVLERQESGNGVQGPVRSMRVVRPLLGLTRDEIEAYLKNRGQPWREDASNRDLSFNRNRVRHELMPLLRQFNPSVEAALARLADIARDEESFWQAEVARLLPQVLLPGTPVRGGGRAVGTVTGGASCAIELERLRTMAPALRRRVLRAAARSLGREISAEEAAKLLALAGFGRVTPAVASRPGSRLELSGGLRAERTAREIRLAMQTAPFVAKHRRRKVGDDRHTRE